MQLAQRRLMNDLLTDSPIPLPWGIYTSVMYSAQALHACLTCSFHGKFDSGLFNSFHDRMFQLGFAKPGPGNR